MCNGIAHFHFACIFNSGNDITHIACLHCASRNFVEAENSYFIGKVIVTCVDKLDMIAFADFTVYNFEVSNDATEGVEYRIENERFEWRFGFSLAISS